VVVVYVHKLIEHFYAAPVENYKNTLVTLIHLQASVPNVNFNVITALTVHTFIFWFPVLHSRRISTYQRNTQPPTRKVEAESSCLQDYMVS
jgi:hypothetical protein